MAELEGSKMMLRPRRVVGFFLILSLFTYGLSEGSPFTIALADRIAMHTDALRLPCPDWWVEGVVDAHGSASFPECILFEYQDVSLVRTQLDALVRYEGFGQWATPWSRSQDDGAARYIVVDEVGFHVMVWPEGEYHSLLNLVMLPDDIQRSIQQSIRSD